MATINVQFSDATQSSVSAYFGCAPAAAAYENLGTLDSSDSRWAKFYNSMPKIIQECLPAIG
jgi:hypothetical protein